MVPRVPPEPLQPPRRPSPHRMVSSTTKYSFRSFSSSFEADDERSSSADHEDMGPNTASRRPAYTGEDNRLTSRKELSGWYAYGFAAEVFVICGMGSFIPITLEQLARENGVLLSDLTTPCVSRATETDTTVSSMLMKRLVSPDAGQCVIYFLGVEINTASFAMYVFSISVLVQSLLVISISCAADHGNYRKRLLLGFAFLGATATMLFLIVTPSIYLLGGLLAIISNTCFGASFVLLNSFLPLLVRHHPETQTVSPDDSPPPENDEEPVDDSLLNSTAALLPASVGHEITRSITKKNVSIELQLSTQISAKGIGIGYSAGLFLQSLSIVVIVLMKSSTFSLRVVLFLIGAWWFVFTIPAAMWLRPRPGPPLPTANSSGTARTWLGYIGHSWLSLYRTIRLARKLKDIVLFLLAWFLLSDAIATVSGVAILFAKTHLKMAPPALAMISVLGTLCGILGAFTWPLLARLFNMKPVNTILCCIALFEFIPLYGLLGYLPFVKSWHVIGLQQPWEMYPLGMLYGFVLGGLSSYCRSLYGELIPPGSEAAFYALYAITDKGSSIFGPAIVGIIVDRTGEIRPAFWFLACLVGLPAVFLYFVDVQRGRMEGARMAEAIEGFRVMERERGDATTSGAGSSVSDEEYEGLLGEHADVES